MSFYLKGKERWNVFSTVLLFSNFVSTKLQFFFVHVVFNQQTNKRLRSVCKKIIDKYYLNITISALFLYASTLILGKSNSYKGKKCYSPLVWFAVICTWGEINLYLSSKWRRIFYSVRHFRWNWWCYSKNVIRFPAKCKQRVLLGYILLVFRTHVTQP